MLTMLTTLLLLASALVAAEPAPYRLGILSKNPSLGLGLGRRQDAGYSPTQTYCAPGTDCASSCGSTYIQCASTDDSMHCYDPSIKESCCPDGAGNSCEDGYFCTSDTGGDTWCCPHGMDLASCAAAYGLTDALVSQVATAAPTSVPSDASSSISAIETSSYTPGAYSYKSSYTTSDSYTLKNSSSPSSYITPPIAYPTFEATSISNGTFSPATTAAAVPFTGGAGQLVRGGLKGLALAAGALLAL